MKKLMLFVLAGAMLSAASGAVQANDCCCPKKCISFPKLLPRLKSLCSLGCKPKCDPCAPCCAPVAPSCAAPPAAYEAAPKPPVETAPKPADLSPSAADQPKK